MQQPGCMVRRIAGLDAKVPRRKTREVILFATKKNRLLGGGNSNILFMFIPKIWGFMIQFDLRIFFKWVGFQNHQQPKQLVLGHTGIDIQYWANYSNTSRRFFTRNGCLVSEVSTKSPEFSFRNYSNLPRYTILRMIS